MKNRMKKLTAMALGVAMLVGANATPVYAITANLNGLTASAYVTKDDMSATAGTSFGGYGATCKVTARVYYWDDDIYYRSDSSNSTVQPGGTSAKSVKKIGGADVVGGKGFHKVIYGDITWSPTTSTGIIPTSSTEK